MNGTLNFLYKVAHTGFSTDPLSFFSNFNYISAFFLPKKKVFLATYSVFYQQSSFRLSFKILIIHADEHQDSNYRKISLSKHPSPKLVRKTEVPLCLTIKRKRYLKKEATFYRHQSNNYKQCRNMRSGKFTGSLNQFIIGN